MHARLLAFALALALPGLAQAQNREQLQMNADLRMLQEQLSRLQLTSNQLLEDLEAITSRVDSQGADRRSQVAELRLLVQDVSATVNTVREKLDDNTVRVSQLMQELPSIRSGLSLVVQQLNTLVAVLQPPADPDAEAEPEAPGDPDASSGDAMAPPEGAVQLPPTAGLGAIQLPDSPTRIFDNAKSDYASNRLDAAIEGFAEFVGKFPEMPNAPEAQFFIGQSYYQQGQFKEALAAYGRLISLYPEAAEVPDAYYSQGLCYLDLGQAPEARKIFELIVNKFPDSTSALLAAQKLSAPGVVP